MSNKIKKGLGKGMNSLIGDYSLDFLSSNDNIDKKEIKNNEVLSLPLSFIKPNPLQPRKSFDDKLLQELAQSIKIQGILQPIIVEEIAKDSYSIVAGERRYRAAKIAKIEEVPVIIKKFNDIERYEVALIENIQRENLNSIEEAKAYAYLLQESGLTQEELAKKVGKSRSAITNSVRLLQLPSNLQKSLLDGKFSAGHARAYLSIKNPAERELMQQKLNMGDISVREAERIAKEYNEGKRLNAKKNKIKTNNKDEKRDNDLLYVKDKFENILGSRVEITGNLDKGKIIISYKKKEEIERIFQLISQNRDLFEI